MPNLRILAACVALLGAPLVGADVVPSCKPAPDHSNYSGDHGLDPNGAWCSWDDKNYWKPQGVGCKTDSECQKGGAEGTKCVFPFTNGKDFDGINADILSIEGVGFCGKSLYSSTGTECGCGLAPLRPHPGGTNEYATSTPVQDILKTCRDMISKIGYPGTGVYGGCRLLYQGDRDVFQCMWYCNGDLTACDTTDDQKAPRKLFTILPDCPGYKSVPFSD